MQPQRYKNMTQENLVEELGVTRKTINIIENGSVIPKIDLAYKLSLILETTVEALLYILSSINSFRIYNYIGDLL